MTDRELTAEGDENQMIEVDGSRFLKATSGHVFEINKLLDVQIGDYEITEDFVLIQCYFGWSKYQEDHESALRQAEYAIAKLIVENAKVPVLNNAFRVYLHQYVQLITISKEEYYNHIGTLCPDHCVPKLVCVWARFVHQARSRAFLVQEKEQADKDLEELRQLMEQTNNDFDLEYNGD